MRKHADIMRPKFEAVINILDRELSELGIGSWTTPKDVYKRQQVFRERDFLFPESKSITFR